MQVLNVSHSIGMTVVTLMLLTYSIKERKSRWIDMCVKTE